MPSFREAQYRYAWHYRQLGDEAEQLYKMGGKNVLRGLALFDRERIHFETAFEVLSHALHQATPEDHISADSRAATLLVSLVGSTAHLCYLRFHPGQRIRWFETQGHAAGIIGNLRQEGNAIGNLGGVYYALGDTSKAVELYQQALVIDRKIGDRRGESVDLGNLGLAYAVLGQTSKAIACYEQQLDMAREIHDRRGESIALNNLGLAYADTGDTGMAIATYEQKLKVVREIGDLHGEGSALNNLGIVFNSLGNL